jgi:hypothetical protein
MEYRHLNLTLQLPLNNECRSRLMKTIDGNHVAYWPPRVRVAAAAAAAAAAAMVQGSPDLLIVL